MLDIILPSLLLVLFILLSRRLLHSLSNTSTRSRHNLPVHRLSQPHLSEPGWTLEWSQYTVSVYTSALNALPRLLLAKLGARGAAGLKRLYDVGSVVGLLGSAAGTAGAIWAAGRVWMTVWDEVKVHAGQVQIGNDVGVKLLKRALEAARADDGSLGASTTGGGLQPLIPGVTVPFSHLPTLLLSLLLNQLIHELGHALSASLAAKLRIAASGPLHNLCIYLLLWSVAFSGLGNLFWRDDSLHGVVVQSVDPLSALSNHLQPGDLISHLDDVFLGDPNDIWTSYLSGDEIGDDGRGWCIDKDTFLSLSEPPCLSDGAIVFVSSTTIGVINERCLSPRPILSNPSTACPCPDVGIRWTCVRPSSSERLLRITRGAENDVILWSGDRRAVLDGVKVGTQNARVWGGGIRWGTMSLEYMSTVAFSLFIFNLLPLPHTDGSQLLHAVLSMKTTRFDPSPAQRPMPATLSNCPRININHFRAYELNSDDEEDYADEGVGRREEAWKRRLRRVIEGGLVAVCVVWAAGWGMVALLRSS